MKKIDKYVLDNAVKVLYEANVCQDKLVKCYFDKGTFYESDIKDTRRKITEAIELLEMIRDNK